VLYRRLSVTDICIVSYQQTHCMLLETICRRTSTLHMAYDTLACVASMRQREAIVGFNFGILVSF